jgi:P4 family phage/plasmid primase-like protien
LIGKIAPVNYDRDAKCPGWLNFLDTVADGNKELAAYLQRCIGYSLTGETIEHALFLLHGTGANGKSTFLEVLRHVFGEYAQTADFSSFLLSKGQPIRNDLAKLNGARFVTATESEDGKRMAESVIKQLTGGDNVTARFLYSEHFEFKPAFKLWLGTNHKPVIAGTDNGIWRRIRLIPFEVCIPPERQDRKLVEKLKLEASGILNWALEGLAAWKAGGLQEPAIVKDATSEYRQEQDALMHFIAARCVLGEDAKCQARDLYVNYKNWAMDAGEWFTMNERQFSQALSERGFKYTSPQGTKWWKGLQLKPNADPDGRPDAIPTDQGNGEPQLRLDLGRKPQTVVSNTTPQTSVGTDDATRKAELHDRLRVYYRDKLPACGVESRMAPQHLLEFVRRLTGVSGRDELTVEHYERVLAELDAADALGKEALLALVDGN